MARAIACAGRSRSAMPASCSTLPARRRGDRPAQEQEQTQERAPAHVPRPAQAAHRARQLLAPRPLGVVTTLHGTDITVVGIEPAYFRITQFSIQSSDRVTAVSKFLKDRTDETFGITKPIEVIYNFVDPAVFAPRRRSGLRLAPPHSRVLMHASNFRPVKNIPAVIRVFSEVRKRLQAKLVMV